MKKLILTVMLVGASVVPCLAQRHPNNSRPYHAPSVSREMRRVSAQPKQQQPAQTQPVSNPQQQPKRGK